MFSMGKYRVPSRSNLTSHCFFFSAKRLCCCAAASCIVGVVVFVTTKFVAHATSYNNTRMRCTSHWVKMKANVIILEFQWWIFLQDFIRADRITKLHSEIGVANMTGTLTGKEEILLENGLFNFNSQWRRFCTYNHLVTTSLANTMMLKRPCCFWLIWLLNYTVLVLQWGLWDSWPIVSKRRKWSLNETINKRFHGINCSLSPPKFFNLQFFILPSTRSTQETNRTYYLNKTVPCVNARGIPPAAYPKFWPGGTLSQGTPLGRTPGTSHWGTPPRKDMGPVEVLWGGDGVPPERTLDQCKYYGMEMG